jgi:hypothetical protein
MIWIVLVEAIAIGFIACGGYMVFSLIKVQTIPYPEDDALFQVKVQYKMRGVIGIAFILLGFFIIYGTYKTY